MYNFYVAELSINPGGARFSYTYLHNDLTKLKKLLIKELQDNFEFAIFHQFETAKLCVVQDSKITEIQLKPLITYSNLWGQRINLAENPYVDDNDDDPDFDEKVEQISENNNLEVELDFNNVPDIIGTDKLLLTSDVIKNCLGEDYEGISFGVNDMEGGVHYDEDNEEDDDENDDENEN